MSDAVLLETDAHIGVLTLNRPTERNCMSADLLAGFQQALSLVAGNDALRCLVITGSGDCFSAGANLKKDASGASQLNIPGGLPHEASYAMYKPFLQLRDLNIPVIGALNGHAVGGGFGLSLMCDIRIAHADSKYGANFARLGICSGMGISYILPRLVGVAHASEMLFTGQLIQGTRAAEIGLVSEATHSDKVLPKSMVLAQRIASSAPIAVQTMKRAMRRGLDWQVRDAAMYEAHMQADTLKMNDAKEGIDALLTKRSPQFTGQ